MFKQIFLKDIRLSLKDFKFQLFFTILFILFIISGIVSGIKYNNFQTEFLSLHNTKENFIRNYTDEILSMIDKNVIIYINKTDESLLIHNRNGFPQSLSTNTIHFSPNVDIIGNQSKEVFSLNWLFIVGVLSSFIVLIFSFNAISYEKRHGMLRLQSVFTVKRNQIILSKYLSLLFIYLICIIPSGIVSLLLYSLIIKSFHSYFLLSLIIFIVVSLVYVSFFILLGIFISLAKNFRNSIVVSLTMWLLFIIIIPSSAGIIAKKIQPIITQRDYSTSYNNRYNQVFKEWSDKYDQDGPGGSKVRGNGYMQEGLRYAAIYDATNQANTILLEFINSKLKQIELIDKLEMLSPYGHLRLFTEILFDQGLFRLKNELSILENRFNLINNELKEIDKDDERSLQQMYKYANWDRYALTEVNLVPFTDRAYPNPEKLLSSEYLKPGFPEKISKSITYFLLLLGINLFLFLIVFGKFSVMDIR